MLFLTRLAVLIVAGIVLPLVAIRGVDHRDAPSRALAGEWLGRWLFFVSVVPKNIAAAFTSGERKRHELETHGRSRQLYEEYAFARSESTGYTSAKKIPDHWVPTTCGYCSVGCGIEIGVKDGKAVASRPLAAHPVNRGKLCPKGLSEHYIIDAENRAKYPLLRKNGKLERVGWDEALTTMVERFRATQAKYGAESLGVLSTGQLVTEEFYTLGKLVQLGFGTNNYDGNTTLCMASAVSGYKNSFGSDGPPGAYEDLEQADVVLLIGANIADNHPILCQYLDANRTRR